MPRIAVAWSGDLRIFLYITVDATFNGGSMRGRNTATRIVCLMVACVIITACGDSFFRKTDRAASEDHLPLNAEQLLDVRKRAATLQTAIDRLPSREYDFSVGDTSIHATLYGQEDDPVIVDERWFDKDGNTGRYRYYFEDGGMFHFYGRSSTRENSGTGSGEEADILTRLYFNSKGNMFEYEKQVNGISIDMEAKELPHIMRRSEALRMLAYTDSIGGVDTTTIVRIIRGDADFAKMDGLAATYGDAMPDVVTKHAVASTSEESSSISEQSPAMTGSPDEKGRKQARTPTHSSQPEPDRTAETRREQTTGTRTQPRQPSAKTADLPKVVQKAVQQPVNEDVDAIIPVHTHKIIPGTINSNRVRFQKGSTGVTLSARVQDGRHEEYVLRARRGQTMSVTLSSEVSDVFFRVFLDDGDISGERRSWSGSLPRYGDYHVVVYIRRGSAIKEAGFTISVSIH